MKRRSVAKGPVFAVVGGAGMMGRITVRDLVETAPKNATILIADYNLPAAKRLVRALGDPRLRAVRVDIHDVAATAKALGQTTVAIAAVQHHFNLAVMKACLRAGCHYIDLGGLFHVTRQQLPLHAAFAKKGLLALLGMGAAPGIVNVLARKAGEALDRVHEIHIQVGNVDRTPGRTSSLLGASYSMRTIIEEASLPAALFTAGKWTFVEALSGELDVDFPRPVGRLRPAYTLHSEVATLPISFKKQGIREVSFRIAFPPELVTRLKLLRGLGLLDAKPVSVGKVSVPPVELLLELLKRVPPGSEGGQPDEYEVLRVVVRGERAGRRVEKVLDCHTAGIPAWGLGIDVDTGCPPSICAQLIASGVITARGVLPPEQAIPVEPFIAELARRGMHVKETES